MKNTEKKGKKVFTFVMPVIMLILIVVFCIRYCFFVSETIYTESVTHLAEVYHQSNESMNELVRNNWANLHLWTEYLMDVSDAEAIDDFVEEAGKIQGFSV